VNARIVKLFAVILVLFALLIAWTSRWTVFDASSLNNNPLNVRTLIDQLKIKRGQILADDGTTVLAKSVPAAGGTWSRVYPQGSRFAQVVGYSQPCEGCDTGLERSRGPALRGLQTGLDSIFGQLTPNRVGDDVYTTLDPKAQQVAIDQLAGRAGAVVALDPQTGAVKVMYANPTFDNNNPPPKGPGSTFNNSTQAFWPPGSTFKVVTAAAALDSGKYTSSSTVNGNSPITISGVPLANDNNQSFGPIDLTTALVYSVNTVWAHVAEALGRSTMTKYMMRFGFYAKPPLDYPSLQLNASQPWTPTIPSRRYPPGSPDEDIGRIGIGQGGLLVTPLQMAMVAAAVANGGTLMTPHLTDKVVDQTGRTVETIRPTVYSHVMKPGTAAELTQMMTRVVEEGTGQAAELGGISVAGKTGTASIGKTGSGLTQPWFIGFAPVQDPKVAVAVTIEKTKGGFGGTVAAPIAKAVIQTLLAQGG
jgi:peptidoglycan glycosyltransferase